MPPLALINNHVPGDAPLVNQLRAEGAIVLVKANLSEWANFRGYSYNGWDMKYFGQEIFEQAAATSGDLSDPIYVAARGACVFHSQTNGIDKYLSENNLDALIAPTWSWLYSWAAVAGYPSASLPAGYQEVAGAYTPAGSPVGFTMIVGKWQEAMLLGTMYDLEQELNARKPPAYSGDVPPEPPSAGICTGKPQMHGGTEKVDWPRNRRLI